MLPKERKNHILELLNINKSVTVKYLCDHLNASEATIRRDLSSLEEDGKLERTHGGAILSSNIPLEIESTYFQKESISTLEKKRIATKAFSYLKEHDSVFLDGGTTTMELAKLIGNSEIPLNIFTNAPHFSKIIAKNPRVEIFMIGGRTRNNTLVTVGQLATQTIKRFRMNVVFIGVNAISLEYGLTTPDYDEAEVKRAILETGRERFVLADQSKFSKVALCQIAPLSAIDYIITNKTEDPQILKPFLEAEISIVEA